MLPSNSRAPAGQTRCITSPITLNNHPAPPLLPPVVRIPPAALPLPGRITRASTVARLQGAAPPAPYLSPPLPRGHRLPPRLPGFWLSMANSGLITPLPFLSRVPGPQQLAFNPSCSVLTIIVPMNAPNKRPPLFRTPPSAAVRSRPRSPRRLVGRRRQFFAFRREGSISRASTALRSSPPTRARVIGPTRARPCQSSGSNQAVGLAAALPAPSAENEPATPRAVRCIRGTGSRPTGSPGHYRSVTRPVRRSQNARGKKKKKSSPPPTK